MGDSAGLCCCRARSLCGVLFDTPPKSIVYDNAFKLHLYCLNREPALYQKTRFFVDRFHWRGYVGCSKGDSLDSYKSMNIKGINSQLGERSGKCRSAKDEGTTGLYEA